MKLLYIISFLAVLVATILYMFFPQVAPFVFSVGVVGTEPGADTVVEAGVDTG